MGGESDVDEMIALNSDREDGDDKGSEMGEV